jgi:hypothetical protein
MWLYDSLIDFIEINYYLHERWSMSRWMYVKILLSSRFLPQNYYCVLEWEEEQEYKIRRGKAIKVTVSANSYFFLSFYAAMFFHSLCLS